MIKINNNLYSLLQKGDNLYISHNDLIKIIPNCDKIINELDGYEDDIIIYNKELYYDINILLMIASDNSIKKEIVGQIEPKYVWNYLLDAINNYSTINQNNLYYLNNYSDYFKTLKKLNNDDFYSKCIHVFDYKYASYYLDTLSDIRKKYNLDQSFGVLKDNIDLDFLIYDSYFLPNVVITASLNAANIFYTIVKEKPFVSYNYEIAAIIALDSLNENKEIYINYENNGLINFNDRLVVSSSDLIKAIAIIEENNNKSREEVVLMLNPLFAEYFSDIDIEMERLLDAVKADPSLENIYQYIIYFTKSYIGYQGYYDYFGSNNSCVYKIHYHGKYENFRLNISKTMAAGNILIFDGDATAYMEAPNDLEHRSSTITGLYDEIQQRSYTDILDKYFKQLKMNLGEYFSNIDIQFDLKWHIEIDTDYEW